MEPCMLSKGSFERNNLEIAALFLTKFDTANRTYTVEDTYFDLGQNWKWTTLIAHTPETAGTKPCTDSYQAVNPKEWSDIASACTSDNLMRAIASVLIRTNIKNESV